MIAPQFATSPAALMQLVEQWPAPAVVEEPMPEPPPVLSEG